MKREDLKQYALPDAPGVYLFKKGRKILYIGKAASLRDRVRSYFAPDIGEVRSPAIAGMVREANTLSYQEAGSVLEALILEANLIKRHQPQYNVDQKDNKSWNYLVVTREDFPRVLVVRGRELFGPQAKKFAPKSVFGPYPHGGQLREALKIVRRIFPYRDTCMPCPKTAKARPLRKGRAFGEGCRPCFNRQLGLCPGVCSGEMDKRAYAERIRHLSQLFGGNFKGLKRQLLTGMKAASAAQEYEKASELRRQADSLQHIRDVSLIKDESRVSSGGGVRIEAFDVAHTSGIETVAVMTVVDRSEPVRSAYRKFKIRGASNDDIAALREALSRRLNHSEWLLPRIFVVDGGKAQMRAARAILKEAGIEVPVVGVVKNEFHRPQRLIGDERSIAAHEKDILLANNEAHRFAIRYHRERRQRGMIY